MFYFISYYELEFILFCYVFLIAYVICQVSDYGSHY